MLSIAIEGIIGAGKSTLAKELGQVLGENTLVLLEPDEQESKNPYLADYYKDPARWAFVMQLHLLQARWRLHRLAQEHVGAGRGSAIVDRSAMGDTAFARLQYKMGYLSEREWKTYSSVYHAMTEVMLLPQVLIRALLSPAHALERIQRRMEEREGRKCEAGIPLSYLRALDDEIGYVASVLRSQGVLVLEVTWDVEQFTTKDRERAVGALAERVLAHQPADPFLDLHRRVI